MFNDDMELEFGSDDEIRRRPPEGTIATIQVRPNKDGVLDDFKQGEGQYGRWMVINFEVVDGEFRGEWASTIMNLEGNDRRFRAAFTAITGIDISQGGKVSFADFKEKLISGKFEAEIGPERRKVKAGDDQNYMKAVEAGHAQPGLNPGDLYETGFTSVQKILRRVGDRDTSTEPVPEIGVPAGAAAKNVADDEIPF